MEECFTAIYTCGPGRNIGRTAWAPGKNESIFVSHDKSTSINQSIHPSIHPSINQSINQSINNFQFNRARFRKKTTIEHSNFSNDNSKILLNQLLEPKLFKNGFEWKLFRNHWLWVVKFDEGEKLFEISAVSGTLFWKSTIHVQKPSISSGRCPFDQYETRDAEWATGLERAPPVRLQYKVWLETPSINRWLTPRP